MALIEEDENRGDMHQYEEMVKKIDVHRDKEWIDRKCRSNNIISEEKEHAEMEPEK